MKRESSKDEVSKLSCFSSIPFWYEGKVQSRQRNKLLFKMTKTHKKNKQFSKSYGLLYSEKWNFIFLFSFSTVCVSVKPVFWPSLNWLLIRPKTLNWRRGKLFKKFIFRKEYKSIEVFTQPRVTKNDHHIVVNKTFRS